MNRLNILIVEDELITANDIQETLQKAGHTVIALARNFNEAMAVLNRQVPDLALVDIHLGDESVDGIGVAQALRANHPIPIIFLTAHSEDPVFLRAKETGPAAYLLKPFRHRELAMQVELAYYHHQANLQPKAHPAVATDLYLPVKKGHQRVVKADVVYAQADGSYTKIFRESPKPPYIVTMNLGYLTQFFPSPDFYRLSRSLLINLKFTDNIEGNQLFMIDYPTPILIPEASRKELLTKLPIVRTP
jgi:DNA-binding LytR/AlgR family response regulator